MTEESDLDISFVFITLNEEDNLPRSLASLPRGAEIIVLDSGSTDRTVEIARSFGANVYSRAFSHYAEQKNEALSHATRKWIMSLDADEVMTAELQTAIKGIVQQNTTPDRAYRVKRKLVFMGKTLRFGKSSDWTLRLFPRDKGWFEGEIHEKLVLDTGIMVSSLPGDLFHFSYRDLSDYFRRFNQYTSQMAEQKKESGSFLAHVARPWFEFIRRYFLGLGFLDGYPGYAYALVSSLYAFVKYAKVHEKKRGQVHGS